MTLATRGRVSRSASDHPEHIELWNDERIRAWQDYHLSGMPELISAVHLCHALLALSQTGILGLLGRNGGASVDELVAGRPARLVRGYLRYLTVRGVLEEWQDTYRLSARGRLLTGEIALARLGFYREAYGPVMGRLSDLLSGTARYGQDVVRVDGALSRHSGTVTTTSYTAVLLEALRGQNTKRVVDLGCGSGALLVELCLQDASLSGIGIDIAPEAVDAARLLAARRGVGDRLEFALADAFDPATWPAGCRSADAITALGVLHEALRDGDAAVVDIIDRYAAIVTGAKVLFVGEPELRYDDKENDSDFFLVHVLTGQGIPRDRTGWLGLFAKTRLRCSRIYTNAVAGPRTCFYELTSREA